METEFGLKAATIQQIQGVFKRHPEIEKAILYGSRAKGNYRNGSDIDLTLLGNLSVSNLGDIQDELDELLLPYTMDVSIYNVLTNENLKDHINRVGRVFYQKEEYSR